MDIFWGSLFRPPQLIKDLSRMSEELSHSIIRKQPIEKWAEDLKRFDIQ
jgi:hypothetical protein